MIGYIKTWWEYRNLFERLIRRKTICYFDPSENVTVKYQLRNNGTIYVVGVKNHNEL